MTYAKWCEDSNNGKILTISIREVGRFKICFCQLGNSGEFAWSCPPPTQSTFAIHINQIVAKFINSLDIRCFNVFGIVLVVWNKSLKFTCKANIYYKLLNCGWQQWFIRLHQGKQQQLWIIINNQIGCVIVTNIQCD